MHSSATELKATPAGHERGFALLLIFVLNGIVLSIATIFLNIALDQKVLAASTSLAQRALMMAQAGAAWAETQLPSLAQDPNAILALPALDQHDPMCADWEDCSIYHLLTTQGPVALDGGTYRSSVTCYPGACTVKPELYETRTEGVLANGVRSVVEIGYRP